MCFHGSKDSIDDFVCFPVKLILYLVLKLRHSLVCWDGHAQCYQASKHPEECNFFKLPNNHEVRFSDILSLSYLSNYSGRVESVKWKFIFYDLLRRISPGRAITNCLGPGLWKHQLKLNDLSCWNRPNWNVSSFWSQRFAVKFSVYWSIPPAH